MKKLMIVLMMALSASSWAALLVEPYLAYSVGGTGDTTLGTTKSDHKYSGPVYGGRLGFTRLGFSFGLDYSMSNSTLESTTSGVTSKDKVSRSQLGLFAGLQLPILLRFWGTYFVAGNLDGKDADSGSTSQFANTNTKFSNGTGYALGVGYTMLPLINLNFEYRTMTYGKFSDSTNSAAYTDKLNIAEYLLSVSVPLNLF